MITKSEHTVEEVFETMSRALVNPRANCFYGDHIVFSSLRMRNFREHGLKCVSCGIEGIIFLKQKHTNKSKRWHLNLFAEAKYKELVLMTRDHIIPSSKNGGDVLSNLQTMCTDCNRIKGNLLPTEITLPIKPRQDKWLDSWDTFWRRIKYCFFSLSRGMLKWPSYGRLINGQKRASIRGFWIK